MAKTTIHGAVILAFLCSQQANASNSCFSTKAVKELIEASEDIDRCFVSDKEDCGYSAKSVIAQKEINATRLVPLDRTTGSRTLDHAVGRVTAFFGPGYGNMIDNEVNGTGQKISRCHVITSAHLIYKFGVVSTSSSNENIKISFLTGQTCDPKRPFTRSAPGRVMFHMLTDSSTYKCKEDQNGGCELRFILGENDLMIVKLAKGAYDETDRRFFTLDTKRPGAGRNDLRVNCWGFPGHNKYMNVSQEVSDMFLWGQKNAKIFFSFPKYAENGIPTNAIAYKGMSGGGCATGDDPTVLVGIYSNGNSRVGHPAIDISEKNTMQRDANYVSPLNKLADEFRAARQDYNRRNPTKRLATELAQLDSECD